MKRCQGLQDLHCDRFRLSKSCQLEVTGELQSKCV